LDFNFLIPLPITSYWICWYLQGLFSAYLASKRGWRKGTQHLSIWGRETRKFYWIHNRSATALAASLACKFTDTLRPESSKYLHCYIQVTIYLCWDRNVNSWKNHTDCCIWWVLVLVLH